MIIERWRSIKGYQGLYEVSSIGRIKALAKLVENPRGNYFSFRKEKILKTQKRGDGYIQVRLYCNRQKKTFLVHRLVANSFIENPEKKDFINHIDGVKDNNDYKNLEWCTKSENAKHAFRNGLQSAKGEKNSRAYLTVEDVKLIRSINKGTVSYKEIAKQFNTTSDNVSAIINGYSWKHLL